MADKSPVAIPSVGYDEMSQKWDMLHDLLGGTKAMRAAGEKWLPKEPGEKYGKYKARLDRTILFNAYKDTLHKLSTKPFSRPINVTNIPEDLEYLLYDVDSTGKTMETLAQEILYYLINYGVVHVFVDHSVVEPVANGETVTKKDEEEQGARVLITCIPASQLIGWQTIKQGKNTVLTQIRMLQERVEPKGDYGDVLKRYIRVVTQTGWELWLQDEEDKEKWTRMQTGIHTFGRVPLLTLYANRQGFMVADPPMEDLAWMNIVHWQSYSDQRNILRLSRFGILFGKGMPSEWVEQDDIEIGPTKSFFAKDPNADMKYVEHTGKSIEGGAKDLQDIEQKMEILGNMPLVKQTQKLATSVRIDSDRNSNQLQCWIRGIERLLRDALFMACEWRKIKAPEDMAVDIYSDFETAMLGSSDKEFVLKMRQAGEICSETFLKEVKRRGVLSDSLDIQDELDRLTNETKDDLEKFMPEEEENEFGNGE